MPGRFDFETLFQADWARPSWQVALYDCFVTQRLPGLRDLTGLGRLGRAVWLLPWPGMSPAVPVPGSLAGWSTS